MRPAIKEQYRDTAIAYGGSGFSFKERSEEAILDLAIMAVRSGDPSLLKFFEHLPSLDDLRRQKLDKIEARILNDGKEKSSSSETH